MQTNTEPQSNKEAEQPKAEPRVIEPPKPIEDKEKSLLEKVDEIKENMDRLTGLEKTKEIKKKFKMPGFVKRNTRNLKKMMKKNRIQTIILKNNMDLQPTIGEISMGRLIISDFYWNAADQIIWRWMGTTPTAIVCEWDMQPLTQKRLMQQTDELKTWLHPQTILIRAIEAKRAEEKGKGFKFNPMMLVVLGIVAISAYWLFFR